MINKKLSLVFLSLGILINWSLLSSAVPQKMAVPKKQIVKKESARKKTRKEWVKRRKAHQQKVKKARTERDKRREQGRATWEKRRKEKNKRKKDRKKRKEQESKQRKEIRKRLPPMPFIEEDPVEQNQEPEEEIIQPRQNNPMDIDDDNQSSSRPAFELIGALRQAQDDREQQDSSRPEDPDNEGDNETEINPDVEKLLVIIKAMQEETEIEIVDTSSRTIFLRIKRESPKDLTLEKLLACNFSKEDIIRACNIVGFENVPEHLKIDLNLQ